MKILVLIQNVKDIDGMKQGLMQAQSLLANIGLSVFFDYQETTKQFTGIPLNTDTVHGGYEINPNEILAVSKPGYELTLLIYDWSFIFPHPTNPCTNESKSFTNTPMQIPMNFYTDTTVIPAITYQNVLTQFFLHEMSHYIAFKGNVPDYTHNQGLGAFASWSQKSNTDFYLFLIQQNLKFMPPILPIVTITRRSDDGKQTLGDLTYGPFSCKTLERPWLGNLHDISCIPKGTYLCKYTFSLGHLGWTYALQNVTGRSGIRIHVANYYYDLEGCIGLGSSYQDISGDGELDIINSRNTINAFVSLLGKKDFTLVIQ